MKFPFLPFPFPFLSIIRLLHSFPLVFPLLFFSFEEFFIFPLPFYRSLCYLVISRFSSSLFLFNDPFFSTIGTLFTFFFYKTDCSSPNSIEKLTEYLIISHYSFEIPFVPLPLSLIITFFSFKDPLYYFFNFRTDNYFFLTFFQMRNIVSSSSYNKYSPCFLFLSSFTKFLPPLKISLVFFLFYKFLLPLKRFCFLFYSFI